MDNNNKQVYNYTVIRQKELNGGYHACCPKYLKKENLYL